MEVSSHALDQSRVDGVRFHVAAFTNLTRDHLDYHGSMQEYGAAKAKLFQAADLKHIVLNIGDEFGRALARNHAGSASLIAVWVGSGDSSWLADRALHATQVRMEPRGISIELDGSFGKFTVDDAAHGPLQRRELLGGLGLPAVARCLLADAANALAECKPAPGRMEVVKTDAPNKPTVVVDYAHTPDALAKALSAAREHCEGALWCVFGCGGDRDSGKRPVMGGIAESLADQIIVTDDNPRSEDPQAITRDILQGIKSRERAGDTRSRRSHRHRIEGKRRRSIWS